ncbi:unnamed protein product [Urochloa humidicola]
MRCLPRRAASAIDASGRRRRLAKCRKLVGPSPPRRWPHRFVFLADGRALTPSHASGRALPLLPCRLPHTKEQDRKTSGLLVEPAWAAGSVLEAFKELGLDVLDADIFCVDDTAFRLQAGWDQARDSRSGEAAWMSKWFGKPSFRAVGHQQMHEQ